MSSSSEEIVSLIVDKTFDAQDIILVAEDSGWDDRFVDEIEGHISNIRVLRNMLKQEDDVEPDAEVLVWTKQLVTDLQDKVYETKEWI